MRRRYHNIYWSCDWIKFSRVAGELSEAPLFIYDRPATFARIRSVARRWRAAKTDPAADALVVVDYLQLISSDERKERGTSREQEVASWSRGFKLLAKELRVPIIVLSQLNRGVESRGDKRPMMSDLRESGAIEQDADLVILTYRDEVYNVETEFPGVAEAIIAAGRSAPAGTVFLRFQGPPPCCHPSARRAPAGKNKRTARIRATESDRDRTRAACRRAGGSETSDGRTKRGGAVGRPRLRVARPRARPARGGAGGHAP